MIGSSMTRGIFTLGLSAGASLLPFTAAAAQEAPPVLVSVDHDQVLATIEDNAVGVDIWFANRYSVDAAAAARYSEAGIRAFGFDGGPTVDMYDWQSNRLRPWPDAARAHENFATTHGRMGTFEEVLQPKISFDDFGAFLLKLHAVGRAHVNYGTGTPEEAAAWVAHSRSKGYPVRYWEIGQFLWGNGVLGYGNEPDAHTDKSGKGYATNALDYIRAMREADPTIKIGIHLSGETAEDSAGRGWNEEVLQILAPHIDYIDLWSYPPPGVNEAEVLQTPASLAGWLAEHRKFLDKYGAPGKDYEIIIGETSIGYAGGPRNKSLIAALFLPDQLLTLLANGARRVDWFAGHIGPVPEFWYGWDWAKPMPRTAETMRQPIDAQYGEYGLFSSGDCDPETNICQRPLHTPFPAFFGLKMLQPITSAGVQLVEVASSDPLVGAHAGKRPDNSLAVLLINKDPSQPKRIDLGLPDRPAPGRSIRIRYGKGSEGLSCEELDGSPADAFVLSPYSLTLLVIGHPDAPPPTCDAELSD